MTKKVILFTGGGSGGHVIPGMTLIEGLKKDFPSLSIRYIGGKKGIERDLIKSLGIPYKAVYTGKLRRYFSLENLFDIFKLIFGTLQSFFYLMKFSSKDCLIFSTGGFVAVPIHAHTTFFPEARSAVRDQRSNARARQCHGRSRIFSLLPQASVREKWELEERTGGGAFQHHPDGE